MASPRPATPASTVASPTHVTNTSSNPDDPWPTCECGNTPEGGFQHSDADGTLRDHLGNPTDAWDGLHYRCPCGVVFRGSDFLIVARVVKPQPDKLVAPVVHLGAIARDLRQTVGVSRPVFAEAVGLSLPDLRRWEENRLPLRPHQLRAIYAHPAMSDLPRLARAAGIEPVAPADTTLARDSGDGESGRS